MKKELRKRIMYLIYELEKLSIDGIDTSQAMVEAFSMLHILVDEVTYAEIEDMWQNRALAADYDSLTIGLMRFDRDVNHLLLEKKYL